MECRRRWRLPQSSTTLTFDSGFWDRILSVVEWRFRVRNITRYADWGNWAKVNDWAKLYPTEPARCCRSTPRSFLWRDPLGYHRINWICTAQVWQPWKTSSGAASSAVPVSSLTTLVWNTRVLKFKAKEKGVSIIKNHSFDPFQCL